MKILFTGGLPDWVETQLNSSGHEVISVAADAYIDEEIFCDGIKEIDVYVSGGIETCTKRIIETANKLKAIVFLGVDYKPYIDATAAAEKKIPIFNTPGANARAVAELAFLLILLAVRKGAEMLANIQAKSWKAATGFELQNKVLGLLGSGHIAQQMAEIGHGMGMNVIYWGRSGAKTNMKGECKSFDSVITESDILSLHLPLEAGVLLDKAALNKMKTSSILINTSPAKLVDADVLYEVLKSGKLAAAAFDPFYSEGDKAWNCNEAKLFSLGSEKFFITPHAGWCTREASTKMFEQAIKHIQSLNS